MFPALRLWPVLLLAGCAQVFPPVTRNAPPAINERSPGVTVTQDAPPRLAALTFFATTAFNEARAATCTEKLLMAQAGEEKVIRYRGRDMLSADGLVDNRARVYTLLPVQDRIRFELTLLAKIRAPPMAFAALNRPAMTPWA